MNITLSSLDHFHLLNQAQQLLRHGHLLSYFSTRIRPEIEKIPKPQAHPSLFFHYALRFMQRYPSLVGGNHFYLRLCQLFDRQVALQIPAKTQLFAVLSGAGLRSIQVARKRGIPTVIECGSTHTDHQHRILEEEYRRNDITGTLFPLSYRERVKAEFAVADYIQIPTRFVGRTFIEAGVPESKLLYAPYGTDISLFRPKKSRDSSAHFRVICPSGVNLRKGARVLAQAWRKLNWKDAELRWIGHPTAQTRHLFVDQPSSIIWEPYHKHEQLAELYRSCDVLVLPSFEEGLARVLIEGASCGLPLIVTPNTGAEDFLTASDPEGWIIPPNNVDALCEALIQAKANREKTFTLGQRAAALAQKFTWEAYGERVINNYKKILGL